MEVEEKTEPASKEEENNNNSSVEEGSWASDLCDDEVDGIQSDQRARTDSLLEELA
jgi:hypothetical protein